jgi:hypothetical protein
MTASRRSIDQIKKDAKRLGRTLGIAHADALRRIANDHGFPTWEALMAEHAVTPTGKYDGPIQELLGILAELRGTNCLDIDKSTIAAFRDQYTRRFRSATAFIPDLIGQNQWLPPEEAIIQVEPPHYGSHDWLAMWQIIPSCLVNKYRGTNVPLGIMAGDLSSPQLRMDLMGEAHFGTGEIVLPHIILELRCLFDPEMDLLGQALQLFDSEFTYICQLTGKYVVRALEDPDLEIASPSSIAEAVHTVANGLMNRDGVTDDLHGGMTIELAINAKTEPRFVHKAIESFLVLFTTIERSFDRFSPKKKMTNQSGYLRRARNRSKGSIRR